MPFNSRRGAEVISEVHARQPRKLLSSFSYFKLVFFFFGPTHASLFNLLRHMVKVVKVSCGFLYSVGSKTSLNMRNIRKSKSNISM